MDFVSFHTHTTYSYADGIGTVAEHVARVAGLGMRALGLSEHGNVNSHAALERECNAAGIKPIFGVEAYFGGVGDKKTQQKTHLTIFAQNEQGYQNLNKIITQSYLDAHHWPTVSPESLVKNNAGLIVLSGCSDSLISCTLMGGKFLGDKRPTFTPAQYDNTRRKLEWFLRIFGPERFYLEVQRFPQLARTCVLNPTFAELGKELGIHLIATADVHYPFAHQNEMQKVLHASRRSGSVAINEQAWEYDIKLTYPESDQEIIDDLCLTGLSESDALLAVKRTQLLSESVHVELPKAKPLRFNVPTGQVITCGGKPTEHDRNEIHRLAATLYLKEQIKLGFKHRIKQRPDIKERVAEYSQRASTELKVIVDKDFCDYFLATSDLVKYAKDNDVTVGPGRGSAAGSVICYLLGITEIDPLHPTFSRTLFERFIDPTRSDMPDIDLDFDDEKRYLVPQRAREIYGSENVANVANHIGYRGKNSLAGVARAYGLGDKAFDAIAKRTSVRVETDDRVDDSILDVVENYRSEPKIAALLDTHGDKIRQAIELEGNEHSMGTHAGGFVVSDTSITDVCPIYTKESGSGRNVKTIQVIPYEKRDAEHLGMLKMDFLGLSTMGFVGKIREWIDMSLDDLYSFYYRDYAEGGIYNEKILERFRADDLTGIFQYEGNTTRAVVAGVQPENFDELAACNALSRPGPYYGGQTKEYIAVKNGERDWERIHPNFDKHVEWTYGQIVYQEQIMFILRDVAGFDVPKVLRVRKIIGKKLGEFQFAQLWDDFKNGCEANCGLSEDQSARIWSAITTAAGYAFNVAHAYSYALIAWWSMGFKIDYTKEFFAANLAKNGDGKDDLTRRTMLLKDTKMFGRNIQVAPISLEFSAENWRPHTSLDLIVPGFQQFPGIAENTASDITKYLVDLRKRKEPKWADLLQISGVGEKTIVSMYEFTLKEDPFNVTRTEKQLGAFRRQCENGDYREFGLPDYDNFRTSNDIPEDSNVVAFVGLVNNISFKDEVETIRTRTGKSVEEILANLDQPDATKKATIFGFDEFGEVALRVSRFRYASLANRIESIKENYTIVAVWGRTFEGKENSIQVIELWVLDPD